ncbi:MAG: glycosyltransferase [Desulfobacterales bacterium]|nr:glycosyltransferase [Desulfobacterales bacterium]
MPLYEGDGTALHPDLPQEVSLLFSPDGIPATEEQKRAGQNMAEYLMANSIDVVLAEYGPTGVAMLNPCELARIPLVTHFHGFDATLRPVLAKYERGYKRLFRQAAAIIAVSKVMEQDLLCLGASTALLKINPYGVNAATFANAKPKRSKPHFVAVGRFVDKKSPATVVRAFVQVTKGVPGSTLTMIGDGPLREKCMKLAAEHGVSDRITFPGSLSHAEVADAMRHARCFVQHSVTSESGDKEGTPNSVLEASVSGLPVVSTRHAGIPEAVIHGKTGLLCNEGDEAAMVKNMLVMAENPELAGEYGCAGRRHIMTKYDANNQLNNLLSILVAAWENYRNQHE